MAAQLPSTALRRAQLPQIPQCIHQKRFASLLRRPHRPYTFTQLVTLSDGSTYLTRTTSPLPIYRSTKDTRNHLLWQPSLSSLRNVEQDEAGRLRAFRSRFGRGWDLDAEVADEKDGEGAGQVVQSQRDGGEEDSLMDLISGAGESYMIREREKAEAVEEQNTATTGSSGKRGKLVKADKKDD